jgi:hypothetical protein
MPYYTTATGLAAHAEGHRTIATQPGEHAEGYASLRVAPEVGYAQRSHLTLEGYSAIFGTMPISELRIAGGEFRSNELLV